MTSREPLDLVPVRLWGFDYRRDQCDTSRQRLAEIAREYQLDLLNELGARITNPAPPCQEMETRASRHEGFMEDVKIFCKWRSHEV